MDANARSVLDHPRADLDQALAYRCELSGGVSSEDFSATSGAIGVGSSGVLPVASAVGAACLAHLPVFSQREGRLWPRPCEKSLDKPAVGAAMAHFARADLVIR
jgi:hypothetical protein